MKQTNKIIMGLISLLLLVSCQTSIDDEATKENDYKESVNNSNENSSDENKVDSKNIQEIIEQFGEPIQKVEILKNSQLPNYTGARKVDKILPYEHAIIINDERVLLYISNRWAIFDENLNLIKELNVINPNYIYELKVVNQNISHSSKYFFYIDESGRCGTMSDDGEILIAADDEYDTVDYTIIGDYFFNYFTDLDNKTYLISKDGSSTELVNLEDLKSFFPEIPQLEKRYSDDSDLVAMYNSNEGMLVTDYIYDEIEIDNYYNKLDNGTSFQIAVLNGLEGVLNSTGEILLDFKYESIWAVENGQVIVEDSSTGEISIYDLNQKKFVAENIPSEYNDINIHEIMGIFTKGSDLLISDYLYSFTSWLTEETLVYNPAGELVYTAPSAISVTNGGHIYYKNPNQTMFNPDHVQYTVLDENYEVVFKSIVFDDMMQFENGVYAFFDKYLETITLITKNKSNPLMNNKISGYDIQFFGDYLLTNGEIYHFYTPDTVADVFKD